MIKGKDVKHLSVPQYEDLTIKQFLTFAKDYPEVMRVFPTVEKEIMKLPRQYIINCIYTIVGAPFKDWVARMVDIRHEGVVDKKDMSILMDPEIAQIYSQSRAVSTSNGISYNLMKASAKRRRTKQEIKEQEEQEILEKAEIEDKVARFDLMERQLATLMQKQEEFQQARFVQDNLIAIGLLK